MKDEVDNSVEKKLAEVYEDPQKTFFRSLATIYLALANLPDKETSKIEMDTIISKLNEWAPELDKEFIGEFLNQLKKTINFDNFISVLRNVNGFINKYYDDIQKANIIKDLLDIAASDSKITSSEEQFIRIAQGLLHLASKRKAWLLDSLVKAFSIDTNSEFSKCGFKLDDDGHIYDKEDNLIVENFINPADSRFDEINSELENLTKQISEPIDDKNKELLISLTTLYLLLAGLDGEYNDVELLTIKQKINGWYPNLGNSLSDQIFKESAHTIKVSSDFSSLFSNCKITVLDFDVDNRINVVKDLIDIAISDGKFHDDEKEMINMLASAWKLQDLIDIDEYVNEIINEAMKDPDDILREVGLSDDVIEGLEIKKVEQDEYIDDDEEENYLCGIIDTTGKEIVPCKYDEIKTFSEGLAAVRKNGSWGFIDKNGNEVIPCIYEDTWEFSEGLAPVAINSKWGYIDKTGKQMLNFEYDSASTFFDGYANVEKSGLRGFIDKKGSLVTEFIYDFGKDDHSEGLCVFSKDRYYGYVDKTGREVIPFKYDDAEGFSEGLASVQKDGLRGYIDKTGNEIIPFKYEYAGNFSEGLASVQKDDMWGYIDKTGKEVVPLKYNETGLFFEGLAWAKIKLNSAKDEKQIETDATVLPNEIIAEVYKDSSNYRAKIKGTDNDVTEIIDNLAKLKYAFEGSGLIRGKKNKNGSYEWRVISSSKNLGENDEDDYIEDDVNCLFGYIDRTGKEIVPFKYDNAGAFCEGLTLVLKDGLWGYIDKTGNEIIPCQYECAGNFSEGFALVNKDGLWGYVDKTGKEVVPFIYDGVGYFSEGFALVNKDGLWGYVDKTGREIVPFRYDDAEDFIEGLAVVKIKPDSKKEENVDIEEEEYIDDAEEDKNLWGFIDKTGKIVIPCKYDETVNFIEGFAAVKKDGLCGYVNKTGKEVIPCKYDFTYFFHDGLAPIQKDGLFGYVDKIGEETIPCKYQKSSSFVEGLASVQKDGLWGYIDKTGNEIIPFKYEYAGNFSEGLASVQKDGLRGYIDKTGNEIIPFKYENAWGFNEGLAPVQKDNLWGYINKSGVEVVPYEYDETEGFREGLALVKKDGLYGYIDKTGKEIVPFKYDNAEYFCEGLALVKKDGLYGYIDKTGNEIIPCKYENAWGFNEGLAPVQKDSLWGYINKSGVEVVPYEYDETEGFREGLAMVERDGLCGYVDKTGREVIPFKYKGADDFCEGLAKVCLTPDADENEEQNEKDEIVLPDEIIVKVYKIGNNYKAVVKDTEFDFTGIIDNPEKLKYAFKGSGLIRGKKNKDGNYDWRVITAPKNNNR